MNKVYLCPKNKGYLYYSQVPKIFIRALVLSEDAAFFSHKGFDWHEIKESFRRNIKEWRFARGGSTITQQLAKNLYLSKEKTLARKIKEVFIARQIEEKLKKGQILEKYLNVVEFGKSIYGLNKATFYYFNKSPSELHLLESVYLVSLLPSPLRLSKSYGTKTLSKDNLWRMKIILGRLFRSGRITEEVYDYAKNIMSQHPWPFPHYAEEKSYLGQDYKLEEENLEEDQQEDSPFDEESIKEQDNEEISNESNEEGEAEEQEETSPLEESQENETPEETDL